MGTERDERAEREERAGRLRQARAAAGYSSTAAAARNFGWNANTYKAHESGRNGFGIADARRYATAFGVSVAWLGFADDAAPPTTTRLAEAGSRKALAAAEARLGVPVRGEVAAGNWLEPDEFDEPRHSDLFVPPDPRYPLSVQQAWVVRGRSVERVAKDGEVIISISVESGSVEPRHGDVVIAQRSRSQGGLIERTAKRLRITRDRRELVPEYEDEALNKPLEWRAGDDTEVTILGVAIGVYRPIIRSP